MKIPETDIEINEKCIFCDEGKYEIFTSHSWDPTVSERVQNLGLKVIGHNYWNILICNKCGNLQLFRPDLIEEI